MTGPKFVLDEAGAVWTLCSTNLTTGFAAYRRVGNMGELALVPADMLDRCGFRPLIDITRHGAVDEIIRLMLPPLSLRGICISAEYAQKIADACDELKRQVARIVELGEV